MPDPMNTPTRSASDGATWNAASRMAISEAAMA